MADQVHVVFNLILPLIYLMYFVTGQSLSSECPLGWEAHGQSCYLFVFHEQKIYDFAASSCFEMGSGLVSVNTYEEHVFITNYLNRHARESMSEWYTSGQFFGKSIKWYGDGTYSNVDQNDHLYWNSKEDQDDGGKNRVVYKLSDGADRYFWTKSYGVKKLNYMCEIPLDEVYHLLQHNRDFDFGLPPEIDLSAISKGPVLLTNEVDVVVVGSDIPLVIDCVATGNPSPTYQWSVKELSGGQTQEYNTIRSDTSSRYTFSNGRLTISSPQETEDAGIYQCMAENSQGSILSPPLTLSFGYLDEFSPNQQGFVEAKQGQGTFLSCKPPNSKPDLGYVWYKNDVLNFIRPELDKYYFISSNGNLYLSETQETDSGNYYCVVTLMSHVGERLSTSQPPSRTSRAIELRVPGYPDVEYGPIIHPDFINVFPKTPLIGHDVILECFAYGRLPLQYSWSRDGGTFPPGTTFMYNNRVMMIPKVQVDAEGNYTCHVVKLSGKRNSATKSILLQLESKPIFLSTLRNMHVDIGSDLTWRCEARAIPRATYTWYKNAIPLDRVPGIVDIKENVLTIKNLDTLRDDGMYQCQASNIHGTTLISAQLRVLSIKPTFAKNPLPRTVQTSQGGNLTISCQPEAAPHPEITWLHNGQVINYGDGRRSVMMDGTLQITQMTFSDQGVYICKAENVNGADESSTRITVITGIQFQTKPIDQTVAINQTAFLYCNAMYDYSKFDLIYRWKFNGYFIDTKDHQYYRAGNQATRNGLYIVNAQYRHSGVYECIPQTVTMSLSAKATLKVKGPPSEPAGVFIEPCSCDNDTVRLIWTWNPAANNGYPVLFFDIEAITDYADEWSVLKSDIDQHTTIIQNTDMKRYYDIDGLLPYNSYRFRVRAKNAMGVGGAGGPSIRYKSRAGRPVSYPIITNKGGGSVGLLKMEWMALPRSEEGGLGFGYKVYWRMANETQKAYSEADVGNVTTHYVTIGADFYYLTYSVKIQAYNEKGYGPIAPEAIVYSAEGMPVVIPSNIRYDAINGTALMIKWDPVPNTREAAKGRVAGYEINFVDRNDDSFTGGIYVYGQTDHGLLIGLEPHGDYWVVVYMFNGAGASTVSEKYLCQTDEFSIRRFPNFVWVFPHGQNSALVKWRGVDQVVYEATLTGYKIIYWPVGDDIRTANFKLVYEVYETVIYGLLTDVIYNLRVLAVNNGGEGKKSPTVYFSIYKDGSVNVDKTSFDPVTTEFVIADASVILIDFYIIISYFILFKICI